MKSIKKQSSYVMITLAALLVLLCLNIMDAWFLQKKLDAINLLFQ